jgi:hypothetical protein
MMELFVEKLRIFMEKAVVAYITHMVEIMDVALETVQQILGKIHAHASKVLKLLVRTATYLQLIQKVVTEEVQERPYNVRLVWK